MKKFLSSGLALSVVLALVGCGGGGGSSTPTTTSTTTTTSGTASDGYLSGSTVCFDANGNGACDADEPVTVTNANGSYSLVIAQTVLDGADVNASLLIKDGIDIDSKKVLVGTLRAPHEVGSNVNVTPLSTLATALMQKKGVDAGEAYATVATALGLTEEEVKADPVKLAVDENNTKVIESTMSLHRVVTMMADVGDINPENVYDALTEAIESAAEDTNDTNKSVASIVVRVAEDANSTLPDTVKQAALVAPVIEKTVKEAVENNPDDLASAAVVSDVVVESVQVLVQESIDQNETIDDTIIQSIEDNATTTAASVDVVKVAIKNIFNSYALYDASYNALQITDSQAEVIKNTCSFSSASDVNIDTIIATTYSDTDVATLVDALKKAYRVEQVRIYLTALGFGEADWGDPHLDEYIADVLPNFTPDMSKEDFSAALYATGDAELMSLALKISPPENLANLSDVEKAKELFSSLRTQVNSVSNSSLTGYADTEAVKINDALTSVAVNVELASNYLNGLTEDIMIAMDANQTSVLHPIDASGTRAVSLREISSSDPITWAYDINQTNTDNTETHWTGTISFPDIDLDTFDPSSFVPLNATLNGDLPLDYVPVTTADVEDKQTVSLDATITKTTTGADMVLSASISSNGDSLAITDARASVAYTTDEQTQEPLPTYIKLNKFYVDGTVGNYTLSGKLDVNAYTQNAIMAAAGGIEIETTTTWLGVSAWCNSSDLIVDSTTNNYEITYNGEVYYPSYSDVNSNNSLFVGYEISDGNVTDENVTYGYALSCADTNDTLHRDVYINSWTDNEPNNSGYLPSDITFNGKLSNSVDNSYFEGKVTAKWLDAADANLSADEYNPQLNVSLSGALQMPESPLMKVSITFNNSNGNVIDTTYVYDTLSVTSHNVFDATLENGTIDISSSTGIKSTIKVVNGNIDYDNSTLTTVEGKTLGTFADIQGAPVIRYIDGTFESLP
jgi:hypothetical protein